MFKFPGTSKTPTGNGAKRWTTVEKDRLFELIEDFKAVIESKKTDFGTTTKKKEAWDEIVEMFGETPNCQRRTKKQLQDWWKNAKSRSKKEISNQNQSRRKTGGGPSSQPDDISDEAQRVASIVPEQMSSLQNEFDCDAPDSQHGSPSTPARNQSSESEIGPNSPSPQPVRKKAKTTQLLEARHSLVEMEEEEHKIRLETLKLEKDIATATLEKVKLEKTMLQKEHETKMKIFEQQLQNLSGSASTSTNNPTSWSNYQSPYNSKYY